MFWSMVIDQGQGLRVIEGRDENRFWMSKIHRKPMMARQVILPALGMAQETGIIVRWLKAEGDEVTKGESLAEIETDKATVEIEAPASGVLANITGAVGVEIPVGQMIASILAPGEFQQEPTVDQSRPVQEGTPTDGHVRPREEASLPAITAS